MLRRLPPLNALRAFEAAGRRGGFSAAADELGVTHAAVSRHVRGLEHRLGVQLFRTVARGVELTEEGAAYLARLTPALDEIEAATDALTCGGAGAVSISCEPTFALKWLMPRLGSFRDAHPEIEMDIASSAELADVARYECDLAIRFLRKPPTDGASDAICAAPVHPYAAPSFPDAKRPEDLLAHRLLHEDRGDLWRRWFAHVGAPDAAPRVRATPLSTLLAIEGALAGQGVVLASAELVANDVAAGRLKRLSDRGIAFGGYHLVYLPEVARRRPVRAFRDWFVAATAELRDAGRQDAAATP